MDCKGLVHIYCGDGKGKTTAATGLAVRCAGGGGKVLFYQFLKDGTSNEINILRNIDNIDVMDGYKKTKFYRDMSQTEKAEAKEYYIKQLENISQIIVQKDYDLLVLDEALHAVNMGFIPLETMVSFIKNKPLGLELVLTGRNPNKELLELADYVSDICKIKHPFDKGIMARNLIES